MLPEHSFEGLLNLHRYLGSLLGREIESSLPITLVGARGLRLYPCVTCGVGERSSHLSGLELVRLQVLEIWFCHNVDLFERLSGACHLALKSFGRDEELRLTAVDRLTRWSDTMTLSRLFSFLEWCHIRGLLTDLGTLWSKIWSPN